MPVGDTANTININAIKSLNNEAVRFFGTAFQQEGCSAEKVRAINFAVNQLTWKENIIMET